MRYPSAVAERIMAKIAAFSGAASVAHSSITTSRSGATCECREAFLLQAAPESARPSRKMAGFFGGSAACSTPLGGTLGNR